MHKIDVRFLKPGMIVGKTILNSDGQVIISEGMTIKEQYINKLITLGIADICIKFTNGCEIIDLDIIKNENRIKAKKVIKETMDMIYKGKDFSTKKIDETVNQVLDDLLNNDDIIVNLSDLRAVDDYTFGHSVNVCVLSLITGISLGYDKFQLKKLGVGAILHDIGKVLIPNDILNKPGSLNDDEFEEIKKHTTLGFEIIKKYQQIDGDSMDVILQHHERFDGSGYPLGKKKWDIHEYARIVAVADVYDALTSDRVYKKRIYPHEAIEYLISMGDHFFDYEMVRKFIRYVATYPLGTVVLLSSGVQGVVVENNSSYPNRPKVRCIMDAEGKKVKMIKDMELIKHPNITITKVLEQIR